MFFIDNLRINCLEWECPVDSSSLPADLQWISFALESARRKIICLFCKMSNTLYNNYKYFPLQYVINQATNDSKIKLAGNV